MPPFVALTVCLLFVYYLFRIDRRQNPDTSWTLILPLLWMFLAGSRFLSRWLNMAGVPLATGGEADGSPIDRLAFLLLILLGVMVLRSRRILWKEFILRNPFVLLFFLFGLVSTVWSVDAYIPLKRVPKAFGNVVMAMVIVSDARPWSALGLLLRRLSYLTLPLSIVFIKYFPEYGREYHIRGTQMFTGVGTQKNSLGELCLLAWLGCVWSLLYNPSTSVIIPGVRIRVEWFLLALVVWLMTYADSATSLVCLVAATGVFLLGKSAIGATPKRMVVATLVAATVVVILELSMGVSASVIEALGRRGDLTSRVPMWHEMMETATSNPWLGAGFEGYWFTDAGVTAFERWQVRNAHNGYLETYLSSGYIGLMFLVAGLMGALFHIFNRPQADRSGTVICLAILVVVILSNWTESAFRSASTIWTLSFVAGLSLSVAAPATFRLKPSAKRSLVSSNNEPALTRRGRHEPRLTRNRRIRIGLSKRRNRRTGESNDVGTA